MTSSKLILIFLAFIFLIIVLLSSSRISAALRLRFGKMIPSMKPTTEDITPTPTPTMATDTPTPTPTMVYGKGFSRGNGTAKGNTAQTGSIPATGPADLVWLLLGGSFTLGVALKKITAKKV